MKYDRPELQQRLASEYVLGTLHGRARKRFQRLLAQHRELREAVALWERELVPLASSLTSPPPSPQVWDNIAARVAPGEPRRLVPAFSSAGWACAHWPRSRRDSSLAWG
jgi:anti-sigma-K factor RskA